VRKRVYVAGPLSTGDPVLNTKIAIEAGDRLLGAGWAPFVPHLSWYWESLHTPHNYETWMELDLPWVSVADAVLRLPGTSPGADREVALALSLGIPVYYDIEEML
jgi:hypothetical protein